MYRQLGNKDRLSHEVANHILMLIQDGQLKPGDKLPSEQELTQLFGLSRPTIREAIHSLVARNILDVTHGRGTFVSQNPGVETDPLGLSALTTEQLGESLPEARVLIEPGVAGLAAKNATPEDMEAIETHLSDMEQIVQEGGVSMSVELEFHRSIANASKNLIIQRIVPIILESIMRTYSHAHRTREEHAMALEEHRNIVKAIRSGEVEHAEEAMRQHLLRSSARTFAKMDKMESEDTQDRNASSG
jgi:DNA-binding FadR family transcriptional regulator